MKSKHILIKLIEYLELFEATVPDAETMGVEAFLAFVDSIHRHSEGTAYPPSMEVGIARELSLLHRFSRSYIKRALTASECLQSEEEYTYLVCLMSGEKQSKTELHLRNGLEKTTGAEVLRRLKRHSLIAETPAPNDKRSILVSITPRGRAELMRVLPELRLAARILAHPISQRQQASLHHLLGQMTHWHSGWTANLKDAPLASCASTLGLEVEPPNEAKPNEANRQL